MQKFLRTMLLVALFAVPMATRAQDRVVLDEDFAVAAPEGWQGGTAAFSSSFSPNGVPSWTYEDVANQGFAAGHYTVNLYAPNRYFWAVTPAMDLSQLKAATLSFGLGMVDFTTGATPATVDDGKVIMLLARVGYGSWQTVARWSNDEGDNAFSTIGSSLTEFTIELTEDMLASNVRFAFYAANTSTREASINVYLDDVKVAGDLKCLPVTDLMVEDVTASSISVSWADELNPAPSFYRVAVTDMEGEVVAEQTVLASAEHVCTLEGLEANTSYIVSVYTHNSQTVFSEAASTNFTSAPSCPAVENLAIDEDLTVGTTVVLKWDAIEGASYIVSNGATVMTVTGASATFEGLEALQTYTFTVRPVCGENDTARTQEVRSITYRVVPEDLCVFTLNMHDSYGDGWNGGHVEMRNGAGVVLQDATFSTGSEETEEFLVAYGATVEFYIIHGEYESEESFDLLDAQGNVVFSGNGYTTESEPFYTFLCGKYSPVENLAVSEIVPTSVTLTWENPNDEQELTYAVRLFDAEGALVDSIATTELSYSKDGLAHSSDYVAIVGVVDGEILIDATLEFSTPELCPGPVNFAAVDYGRTYVDLVWQSIYEDMNFELVKSEEALDAEALAEAEKIAVAANEYSFTDLNRGSQYYFYLRSACGEENSNWRNVTVWTNSLIDCNAALEGPTVAEGPQQSQGRYIPIYGYYCDATYNRSQSIYPASMLEDLVGSTISSLKYKVGQGSSGNWASAVWTVKVGVTTMENLASNFDNETELTTVYTGTVTASVADGMTVNFDEPFLYTGGNLVIEFWKSQSSGYTDIYFCGTIDDVTSASRYMYGTNPSASGNLYNFLPQVTFGLCAVGEACPAVAEVNISELAEQTATLTWERPEADYLSGYEYILSETEVTDFDAAQATGTIAATATSIELNGLYQGTYYYFYLRAICERDEAQSEWAAAQFRTLEACRVAENIEVVVTGKHTAHASWVNSGADLDQASNYSIVIATEANLDADVLDDMEPVVEEFDETEYDFADLESGTTYYMYIRNVCMIDGITEFEGSWMMSEAFTMPVALPAVVNLQGTASYGSVSVTWESDASLFADQNQWKVAIRETADDNAETTWTTVDEPEYTFLSLDADVEYTVTVVAVEGDQMSEPVEAQFRTLPFSGCALTFETTNSTSSYVPFETNWLDTRQHSQTLYTAEDLPAEMIGAEIYAISFYVNSSTNWTWSKQALEIRVMATEESSISGGFIDVTDATLVNEASGIAIVNGVLTLQFTTPFVYNGGNILIDMNVTEAGNYQGVSYVGITKQGASRYQRGTSSASNYNFLPKTEFCYNKNPEGCVSMNASNIVVSDVTTSSANVSWKPGYQETEWEYAYSTTDEPANNTVTTSLKANLSGLERNVDYNFFVRPVCGEETGDWSMITFATGFDCAEPVNLAVSDITTESATLTAMAGELGTPEGMTFRVWKDGAEPIEMAAEAVENIDTVIVALEETGEFVTVVVDSTYELGELIEVYYDENGEIVEVYDTIWNYVEEEMPVYDTTFDYVSTITYVATVEGLQGSTYYNFAAASNCGETDGISRFSTPVVFGTQCNGEVSLPLNEDFSANSLTKDCWEVIVADELDVQFSDPTIQSDILWVAGTTTAWNSNDYFERYVISPKFEGNAEMVWLSNMSANNYAGSYADSCEFGYSTTTNDLESFVWIEKTSRNSYSNTLYDFQYFIPADAKYVAYHFRGQKADWMRINTIAIRELDSYHMAAANADPELGTLYVVKNGNDTLEVADSYDETVSELTALSIVAQPIAGHHVDNWTLTNGDTLRNSYGSVVTSNVISYTVGADRPDTNVTVHFKIDDYSMQVAVNNANYGSVYMDNAETDEDGYVRMDTANVYGTMVTVYAEDADETDGYIFRGWSKSSYNMENNIVSYENPYTFGMDGNYTLTAVFVIDSNHVTVNYDPTMGVVAGAGGHSTTESTVHMGAVANYGYEFVKWMGANGFETTEAIFDTANTNDMTFTAVFQKLPYYLQVASNDPALGIATASALEGLYMDEITLIATATDPHYHFEYWNDGSVENPYTFALTQDTMMRAFFVIDTHKVQLAADDWMGMVTLNGEEETEQYFDYGTEVEIEAIPNVGVAFTQWSDGNTEAQRTITVENDVELVAQFDSILYNITVNYAENEGTVSMAGSTIEAGEAVEGMLYGQTFELTAEASTGYVFTNWTDAEGNIYEDATVEYTVNANEQQTLTANFAEGGKVNVNLLADAEMGSVMGNGSYNNTEMTTANEWNRFDEFSTFTMVATPVDHYHFVNWTIGDEVVSEEATYEVELPEGGVALYYTANFAIDQHTVTVNVENATVTINGVEGESTIADYGTEMNVVLAPTYGYHFVAWEGGRTELDSTFVLENDVVLNAEVAIDVYAVSFASNDATMGTVTASGYMEQGDEEGTVMYAFNSTAHLTAVPNEGYHFVQWNNGSTNPVVEFPVYSEESFVATFAINVYNVEAVVNNSVMGSVEGPATVEHFQSAEYTAEANYGYHFVNWTVDGVVASTAETITVNPVADMTIVANFDYNQYTATMEVNDAAMGSIEGETTVTDNYLTTVEVSAVANNGYHFVNWTVDGTAVGTETSYSFDLTEDVTVVANFAKNQYAASVSVNDATMGSATVSEESPLYLDVVTFEAVAADHYSFAGWKTANGMLISTDESIDVTITSDTTLTAMFEAIMFNVSVLSNSNAMGTVTPAGETSVQEGTMFTATAAPAEGYHLRYWTMAGDSIDNSLSITREVTANMVLVAVFEADPVIIEPDPTYTVVINSADATMGSVNEGASDLAMNSLYVAVATANEGYHFVNWTSNGQVVSTANPYVFNVTADITLTANFEADPVVVPTTYTVTVTTDDATMGTVSPAGNNTVEEGATFTVTATAKQGYKFVRWEMGDLVYTNTEWTFTVTADVTVKAVFESLEGIDDVDMENVKIYSTDSKVIVNGAEGREVYVFDVNGRTMAHTMSANTTEEFRMTNTGVYMVKVGNAPAKRVVVVR